MPETTLRINSEANTAGIQGFSKSLEGLMQLLGATGLTALLKKASDEYAESEKANTVLSQKIKLMGDQIGVTSGQIAVLNDQMQKNGMYEDDMVKGAESILLNFDRLSKETFPEVVRLSGDVAAAMGTDIKVSAEMLGRALQEPLTAMRSLRQMNIVLTDSEKEKIKVLSESGKITEAQAFIIDKVKNAYGGMSDIIRNSPFGTNQALANNIKYLNESLGESVNMLTQPFKEALIGAIQGFLSLDEGTKSAIMTAGIFVAAVPMVVMGINGIVTAVKLLTSVMMTNPIILIATAAAAAVAVFISLASNADKIFDKSRLQSAEDYAKAIDKVKNKLQELNERRDYNVVRGIDNTKLDEDIAKYEKFLKELLTDSKKTNQEIKKDFNTASDDMVKKRQEFTDAIKIELMKQRGDELGIIELEKKEKIRQLKELHMAIHDEANAEYLITLEYEEKKKQARLATTQQILRDNSQLIGGLQGLFDTYYTGQMNAENTSAEQKKQLQKEQWGINKAMAIGNTIINTAQAVIAALASVPPNVPLSIAVGAIGAIQTGLIAAQPMPAFARGGITPGGRVLVGEMGAEIVDLPAGSRVHNNQQSKKMLGGGDTHYHFNGNIVANDPVEFYRKAVIEAHRMEKARGVA